MASAAALASAIPASADSLFTYTIGPFPVTVDGRKLDVTLSTKSDTLLVQAHPFQGDRHGLAADWPIEIWRRAAEKFVEPAGCGISAVTVKWRIGATWEAAFVCPAGIDLSALVKAQKERLKSGLPIEPGESQTVEAKIP